MAWSVGHSPAKIASRVLACVYVCGRSSLPHRVRLGIPSLLRTFQLHAEPSQWRGELEEAAKKPSQSEEACVGGKRRSSFRPPTGRGFETVEGEARTAMKTGRGAQQAGVL